jgi:hypothetical protein
LRRNSFEKEEVDGERPEPAARKKSRTNVLLHPRCLAMRECCTFSKNIIIYKDNHPRKHTDAGSLFDSFQAKQVFVMWLHGG